MSWECVFDELGIEEDFWRYQNDEPWALALNRAYNDRAERIVGRRLLDETPSDPRRRFPPIKQLHDVFEARNVWSAGSWWLERSARNEDELARLLDRVEARIAAMREFLLPENWNEEKERLLGLGVKPPLYRGQRGPVTFATSVYGVEDLLFLIMDNPALAARFRDAILGAMLAIARTLDAEAGLAPSQPPRRFQFNDDNCYLLNPEMYEFFGFPILKGVFDAYCPGPRDDRRQHSDSAMSHLLPVLAKLDLTWTNFGPTVTVAEIREHLPHAVIHGQLAPFTFSRNDERGMVEEFRRDFAMASEKRGLVFATAGSINNGSRLTGLRLLMSTIQREGRY
ncbi:MAG: Uroporphyrinogen decarboxylase (URO-D) [candidate division BRC1 bacterium ADurb.BinA364]|nr:MAG: Uroporphyrinogen decarboxylase (URO-D) [candidate division BRC1 bacterium ADurb.BinA364]